MPLHSSEKQRAFKSKDQWKTFWDSTTMSLVHPVHVTWMTRHRMAAKCLHQWSLFCFVASSEPINHWVLLLMKAPQAAQRFFLQNRSRISLCHMRRTRESNHFLATCSRFYFVNEMKEEGGEGEARLGLAAKNSFHQRDEDNRFLGLVAKKFPSSLDEGKIFSALSPRPYFIDAMTSCERLSGRKVHIVHRGAGTPNW